MAEKRMFTQKIIDSDAFLDMPLSAQALYFHLNMRADDDGFINNPKRIQRTIGASDDDLKLLIVKRFVICFENGVIVIKHWRMHNTLRKDRYSPTQYQEQYAMLCIKDNNAYTEKPSNQVATTWQPNGNQMATQYSIDKCSIEENSIYNAENLGEYKNVKFTDKEFEKLIAEFPDTYQSWIEKLSSYMASTGKAYKNHLATIRSWAAKEKDKQKQQPKEAACQNPFLNFVNENEGAM